MSCQSCPNRIFSDLPPDRVATIQKARKPKRFPRKRVIYREGEISQGVFCLRSGVVKRTVEGGTGTQGLLGIVPEGNFLGLESLWGGESYLDTAATLDVTELCFFTRADFLAITQQYPDVGVRLMSHLGARLRDAEKRLKEFSLKNARERLAHALLLLVHNFGRRENGAIVLDLPLSRSELGELAGISRGTASRLMTELRGNRLVETNGRKVLILDPDGLAKLAGEV